MSNGQAATAGALAGSGGTLLTYSAYGWLEQMVIEGRWIEATPEGFAFLMAAAAFAISVIYWILGKFGIKPPRPQMFPRKDDANE